MRKKGQVNPCPLCGGEAEWEPHGVRCRRCGLWLGGGTDAIRRFHEITGGAEEPPMDYVAVVWDNRPNALLVHPPVHLAEYVNCPKLELKFCCTRETTAPACKHVTGVPGVFVAENGKHYTFDVNKATCVWCERGGAA